MFYNFYDEDVFQELGELKLSTTMKNRYKQQVKYANLCGVDMKKYVDENCLIQNKNSLNKQETLKLLDKIDDCLLEE